MVTACEPGQIVLPTAPDPVVALVHALKSCLCAGAEAAGRPLCMCCLGHGERITPDVCDCECQERGPDGKTLKGRGQGWVRVVQTLAVLGATVAGRSRSACRVNGRWQVQIEIGIARCLAAGGDADPATCAEREADAHQGLADEWLLRWIVDCCPALRSVELVSALVAPWGPQGGCAGSTATIMVQIAPPGSTARLG